jgi:hypothetical protein
MQFPTQPRRQFLRFVETVQEFGCVEDEPKFERLLSMIGSIPVTHHPRMFRDTSSRSPMALGFTGPGRRDLERATA